jgi:catechol 2,3-dioxygenase-like lactoylglutathione lyase family enzyme
MQTIGLIALVVRDYDEAIDFYVNKLGFELLEDTKLSDTKRWVRVAPKGSASALLLAKAANDLQMSRVGNQTGGRVFLFLHTDTFDSNYKNLIDNNVKIERPPVKEAYGRVLVFEDLYGNLWDLIEKKGSSDS